MCSTTLIVSNIQRVSFVPQRDATYPNPAIPPVSKIGSDDPKLANANVFGGFATNAINVCRKSRPTEPITLLRKRGTGYMAVRTTLTNENCEILTSGRDTEPVMF
jgi:tRNA(Arg) A34 adenosine deaminase TadA